MEATHYTVGWFALVILNESHSMPKDWSNLLVKLSLREGLEEIASGVFEDAGLYDDYAINGGFDYVHVIFWWKMDDERWMMFDVIPRRQVSYIGALTPSPAPHSQHKYYYAAYRLKLK